MVNNDLDSVSQAFIITVMPLCSMGSLMVQMRTTILGLGIDNPNRLFLLPTDSGYINALFAGPLLETMFLASAHTRHLQLKCMIVHSMWIIIQK